MQLADICRRLGLPKHADRVYEVLSKSREPLLVATVAHTARISRVAVYRALRTLADMGAVAPVSLGKRTLYIAKSPQAFADALTGTSAAVKVAVGKAWQEQVKDLPRTIWFQSGSAGIRAVFDDVIEHTPKGGTFYRYTSERDVHRVNKYLARDYRTRRDRKKLERLVISNPVSGKQKQPRLERFIKFIPPELSGFEQDIIQLVYGDRLALIDLATEQVVIIENKQLADFQKTIFKLLYKRL